MVEELWAHYVEFHQKDLHITQPRPKAARPTHTIPAGMIRVGTQSLNTIGPVPTPVVSASSPFLQQVYSASAQQGNVD